MYKTIIYLFLWAWNIVSHIKGTKQIEGAWEEGAEEIIRT
jgi:hypothetical protein